MSNCVVATEASGSCNTQVTPSALCHTLLVNNVVFSIARNSDAQYAIASSPSDHIVACVCMVQDVAFVEVITICVPVDPV